MEAYIWAIYLQQTMDVAVDVTKEAAVDATMVVVTTLVFGLS